MKKLTQISASLLFVICWRVVVSQNSKAIQFYDAGVAAFNQKDYLKADSLFSISNSLEPHPDTYFSRAACRKKLGNQKGYCEDLANATHFNDQEANKLFWKDCGWTDTLFTDQFANKCKPETYVYKTIIYTSEYGNIYAAVKYDRNNTLVFGKSDLTPDDSTGDVGELMPEFPGGISNMYKIVASKIKIPESVKSGKKKGKVLIKFMVRKNGLIESISVMEGLPNCPECDEEAVRVVNYIPPFKAGRLNGEPVKVYFNLPILFK